MPKAGVTKTRLMSLLSGEQCAALHTAFLQDIARVYRETHADLFVFYTADPNWHMLTDIFPFAKGFFPQRGADLGKRMLNAISHILDTGYDGVILTGTDLPRLTTEHLQSGFAALDKADIAIGPNPDGGYYLIGMTQPHAAPFAPKGYGGESVYQATLEGITSAGLTYCEALPCGDVDTPDDLRELAQYVDPNSFTGKYIQQLRKEGIAI